MRVAALLVVFGACAEPHGQLEAPSATITFPDTVIGHFSAMSYAISNGGGTSTGSLAVTTTGDDFGIEIGVGSDPASTCGAPLAPGQSCGIELAFAPLAAGPRTGTLEISDADGNDLTLALDGVGLSGSAAALTP